MELFNNTLHPISENEFISMFLKGELKSKRFSNQILKAIKKLKTNKEIIINPKLTNLRENNLRKAILEESRKYLSRKGLFEGFPNDIKWYRSRFPSSFLVNNVKYIDYDYWLEITGGSRFPKDAIEKIKKNEKVFDVSYDNFIEASNYFKKGKIFEETIIVSDGKDYVVLEGHLRLTVYTLNQDILPEYISVIIGFSDHMNEWGNF